MAFNVAQEILLRDEIVAHDHYYHLEGKTKVEG
jgi:hypothetical protein